MKGWWVQVGTRDGRVKIVGREGVEHTFFAPVRCPTLFMKFLHNKGAIIRITMVRTSRC
jgi:hypothetical protein